MPNIVTDLAATLLAELVAHWNQSSYPATICFVGDPKGGLPRAKLQLLIGKCLIPFEPLTESLAPYRARQIVHLYMTYEDPAATYDSCEATLFTDFGVLKTLLAAQVAGAQIQNVTGGPGHTLDIQISKTEIE